MNSPRMAANVNKFGFVHHRKLNSLQSLQSVYSQLDVYPQFHHIVEGDLCWYFSGKRKYLYFWHPRFLVDKLNARQLDEARENKKIFFIEDLFTHFDPRIRYIIELKTGIGDPDEVFAKLASDLLNGLQNNFWVDAFSLNYLKKLKNIDNSIPTSLHTKVVLSNLVLKSAVEFPPLNLHRISTLDFVDIITLSYNTSISNFLPIQIDDLCKCISQSGKKLVLGGLNTVQMFEAAKSSFAIAGYAKFPISETDNR